MTYCLRPMLSRSSKSVLDRIVQTTHRTLTTALALHTTSWATSLRTPSTGATTSAKRLAYLPRRTAQHSDLPKFSQLWLTRAFGYVLSQASRTAAAQSSLCLTHRQMELVQVVQPTTQHSSRSMSAQTHSRLSRMVQ